MAELTDVPVRNPGASSAEAALHLSEATRAAILQTALDCIITIDWQGVVRDWNPAAERTFGYSAPEAVGREMAELIIPARMREMHRAGLARAVASGRNVMAEQRIETFAQRRNGDEFPVELSITRIVAGPKPLFTGHIRDITLRKVAEQRQAAQYAVVRALADSATVAEAAPRILEAVCLNLGWDLGTIWQVQQHPGRSNGKPAQQVLRCLDLWHRPGLKLDPFIAATREQRFASGVGLPGRIWQTARSAWISDVFADPNFPRAAIAGRCGLHGAFAFPVSLQGQVLGVVEFFSRQIRQPDIQLLDMFSAIGSQIGQFIERKRIEQEILNFNKNLERRIAERTAELVAANRALRQSEGRYRTVAEQTPAAIVIVDTQAGHFVEVNENAVRLFGVAREDLLKLGPADVSPPVQPDGRQSAAVARMEMRKALDGSTRVFEWVHRRGDGSDVPCEVRVARMPAMGRELVIGAVTDITARKRAEVELRTALEQEKELSRLKSNFVNVVSHEFRTPLGVILSAADILENYYDRLRADQRNGYLQDIRYATGQMSSLMDEVLLLGRVEAGKMDCKPEPLELESFCRRLIDEQASATSGKCPISFKMESSVPGARGDQAVLRHVFSNLLSNAVKYSAAGRPVVFSIRREGADALFEIRDHGIGIPVEDQKHLFTAFHRAGNVGEIPGTGLGLVIVKRCVDLHGGSIRISSTPGRGTTVSIRYQAFSPEASESCSKPAVRRRPSLKVRRSQKP